MLCARQLLCEVRQNPSKPGRASLLEPRIPTPADAAFWKKGVQLAWVSMRWPISPIHDTNSRLRPGDADKETSPATDGAFYPDAPIVGLDDTLADRQPQSRASPRRMIAPPKTVEKCEARSRSRSLR